MASYPSSYIKTVAAADTRTTDSLSLVFTSRPQAMTVYARFVDTGFSLLADSRVWSIGPSNFTGPCTLLGGLSGNYRMFHANQTAAAGGVSSSVAVGSVGDAVELLGQLYSDGSVQIHRSYNGGAITSGTRSAAQVLATAWGAQQLDIAKGTGIAASSFLALRDLKIIRGVFDFAAMRRVAGVTV